MVRFFKMPLGLLLGFALFTACHKHDGDSELDTLKQSVLGNYANMVYAAYTDSYDAAVTLKQQVDAFVAAPTAQGLEACRMAWLAARNPYGQTEAYRFYGGPIDDADGPEGLINAWPMDENFIDYVEGVPNGGLINNPSLYPTISKEVLANLNESISETSIFTGYHAIEFLLWGQDLSTSGPGARPYTDYTSAPNAARRGQYLQVVTDLLLEHLASVRDEWKPGGAYRTQFLEGTDTDKALGFLITSLGEFSKGELAGERIFVAVDTKDQENEHSCFSDNTIADIRMNFQGIKNVYTGSYTRTDGTVVSGASLQQLVEKVDATKAAAVQTYLTQAEQGVLAIPGPFDQTIVNAPTSVVPAIDALRALSDRIADAGLAIGAIF